MFIQLDCSQCYESHNVPTATVQPQRPRGILRSGPKYILRVYCGLQG